MRPIEHPALPASVASDASIREVLPPEQWAIVMRAIAQKHRIPAEGTTACARGSDVVYRLGKRAVVKLTSPQWAHQIDTEATFLNGVSGKLSVAVPEVLGVGEYDGWPYVITSFVEGEHLEDVWKALSGDGRRRVAQQLGRVMAELHAVEVVALEEPVWSKFISAQSDAVIDYQRARGTPEPWLDAMGDFLTAVPSVYPGSSPTVSLHTELLDAHVFVNHGGSDCRVSGLIDFADGMRGKPDYDVAALVEFIFQSGAGLLSECLRAYGWSEQRLNEEEGRRLLACALLHRYSSLPRMLRAAEIPPEHAPDFELLRRRLYKLESTP